MTASCSNHGSQEGEIEGKNQGDRTLILTRAHIKILRGLLELLQKVARMMT